MESPAFFELAADGGAELLVGEPPVIAVAGSDRCRSSRRAAASTASGHRRQVPNRRQAVRDQRLRTGLRQCRLGLKNHRQALSNHEADASNSAMPQPSAPKQPRSRHTGPPLRRPGTDDWRELAIALTSEWHSTHLVEDDSGRSTLPQLECGYGARGPGCASSTAAMLGTSSNTPVATLITKS